MFTNLHTIALAGIIAASFSTTSFAAPPTADIKQYQEEQKAAEEAAVLAEHQRIQAKTSIAWERDVPYNDIHQSIVNDSGEFYIAGRLSAEEDKRIFLAKLSESGEEVWRRDFEARHKIYKNPVKGLIQIGNYILVGGRKYIYAYDVMGEKAWEKQSPADYYGPLSYVNDFIYSAPANLFAVVHTDIRNPKSNLAKFTITQKEKKSAPLGILKLKHRFKETISLPSKTLSVEIASKDSKYVVTDGPGTSNDRFRDGFIQIRKTTNFYDTVWNTKLSGQKGSYFVIDTAILQDGSLLVGYESKKQFNRGNYNIAKISEYGEIKFDVPMPYTKGILAKPNGTLVITEEQAIFIDSKGEREWSKNVVPPGHKVTTVSKIDENHMLLSGSYKSSENENLGFVSKIRLNF